MSAVQMDSLDWGSNEDFVFDSSLPDVGTKINDGVLCVEVFARAKLPTQFGDFTILVFKNNLDKKEHIALVRSEVGLQKNVHVRLHSECMTGDVFGSLRCDCREQFELSMQDLGKQTNGILLYMRQEGRGIGLGNKIRAYALQESGMDTFEANRHLGFKDDLRDYRISALMLKLLRVSSIALATNNPQKIDQLKEYGIRVVERIPLVAEANSHNSRYLRTKACKSNHLLPA